MNPEGKIGELTRSEQGGGETLEKVGVSFPAWNAEVRFRITDLLGARV